MGDGASRSSAGHGRPGARPARARPRPRRARSWWTRRSAGPGTPRRCWPPIPASRWSGWTPTRTRSSESGRLLAPYGDRVTLVHAVYDEIAERARRAGCRAGPGRPVRPRRVLAAARRAGPRVRLLLRRAAGHADGPEPGARPPPRCSTPTRRPELARVLREYGEERFARRIAEAVVRARPRAPLTSTAQLAEHRPRRRFPAPARRTGGQPGQADLPGAADRGQRRTGRAGARRCPPRWTRWPSAAGSWCWPTTRWRTGSSSGRWPPRAADTTPPGPAGAAAPRHGPQLRLLTRGAERPSRRRSPPTRGPPRPGCGPPSGSGTPRDRGAAARTPGRHPADCNWAGAGRARRRRDRPRGGL